MADAVFCLRSGNNHMNLKTTHWIADVLYCSVSSNTTLIAKQHIGWLVYCCFVWGVATLHWLQDSTSDVWGGITLHQPQNNTWDGGCACTVVLFWGVAIPHQPQNNTWDGGCAWTVVLFWGVAIPHQPQNNTWDGGCACTVVVFGERQYHISLKTTHGMVDVAIQHIPQNTRYGGYIGVVFAWVWAASLGIRSIIELAKGVEEMVMLIINWGSQVKYYFCQRKWWRRCVIIAKVCDFEDVCIACWNWLGHCFVVDSESFYPR